MINSFLVAYGQRLLRVAARFSRAKNLSLRASCSVFTCSNIHLMPGKLSDS
jgi:hypothetical protein